MALTTDDGVELSTPPPPPSIVQGGERFDYLPGARPDSLCQHVVAVGDHLVSGLEETEELHSPVSLPLVSGILPTCLLSDCRHDCSLKEGNMIPSIYIQIADIDIFLKNLLVGVDTFKLSFISFLRFALCFFFNILHN